MESDSQTALVKELESFSIDLQDPTKSLQVGNDIPQEANEKLKGFLCKNLDIVVWKHKDIVGIDPKMSFHDNKLIQIFFPHRQKWGA